MTRTLIIYPPTTVYEEFDFSKNSYFFEDFCRGPFLCSDIHYRIHIFILRNRDINYTLPDSQVLDSSLQRLLILL